MRRMLGALLGLAVACAACSDGGADDVSSTTTELATTSTTAPEATTTTSTTAPVPFDIEVRRAAIELLEIRNDVFMHPDVARVSEYIADTCTCLERERGFIERFVAEGVRWSAPPVVAQAVRLGRDDRIEPALTVVADQPAAQIVRDDGTVDEEILSSEDVVYRVVLLRDSSGAWALNGVEVIDLDEASVAEVVAEGLP